MKKILMIIAVVCFAVGIANAQSGKECEVATRGKLNGHEWVDLGLSVKWATCNVGANNPCDYGYLLEWGALNESQDYAEVSYDIGGNPKYDVATATWGSGWRLPTKGELEELLERCEWEWTTEGGHNGYRVTGPSGNSIFLPAAGWRDGLERDRVGDYGYYWSSTPREYDSNYAYSLYFGRDDRDVNWDGCFGGQSVRPVLRETIEYVPIPIVDENIDFDENEFTNQDSIVDVSNFIVNIIIDDEAFTNQDLGMTTDKLDEMVNVLTKNHTEELDYNEKIYVAVEEQAEFPGGQEELMQWIRTNLRYPDEARENNIEGRVIVKLVIEKDGRVTNVEVVKGVREDLDNEVVRLCESMPRWSPGKNNGIAVRSYFTLPVTFRLTK